LIDTLLQANETIVTAAEREGRNDSNEKQNDDDHAATKGKSVHRL
jgi:hypothetical protein